ncbi:hypothetical protein LCGC14_0404520 [marine sediment metagenome]|uniref:Uncharacterized protein n=1 Tax=marine sediment metagenome TaxID=412755 RepID=A0A0F9W514_9ZZZZ
MEIDYRTNLKQQDMALDLEMQQRARMWEVDKMELRSQIDFQREEQLRQRKLDSYDNVDTQLDKEVQSGRMTEKDAEPYRLKNDLARQGMNISVSEITRQQKGDEQFGIPPYWEEYFGEDYEGTTERQFAEAKRRDVIEGRTGTIPIHLDPNWLRANRSIAMQVLESRGILLEEDEIDTWIESASRGETELPLGDKQLDIGVRVQPENQLSGTEETTGLPEPSTLAEANALPKGTRFKAPDGTIRIR